MQPTSKQIDLDDSFPPQPVPNEPSHESLSLLVPYESTNKAYHDLTGRFPHKSSRGYEYLLITYDFDSNAILAEPLKNRTGLEIKKAWTCTYTKLASRGSVPKLYILDNEISSYLKSALKKHNCTYQLVPPHVHRRNAAERAIRTFKEHFLAILASCDPNFPITEWDRLLPQCLITLNLLRNSRVNPKLSAHAYLFGNFDFNKTPLAPPGTRVVIHTKPDKRASWGFHGKDGWYIGPSMNHYRCVKCYNPHTAREVDVDTVQFFPSTTKIPSVSTEDYLKQAATDIISVLQNPPSSIPSLQFGDPTKNALISIARLLNRAEPDPAPVLSPASAATPTPRTTPTPTPTLIATPQAVLPRVQPQVQSLPVKPLPRVQPAPLSSPAPHPSMKSPKKTPNVHSFSTKATSSMVKPIDPRSAEARYRFRPRRSTNFRRFALQHIVAHELFRMPSMHHIYNDSGKKESLDSLLKGPNGDIWLQALSNEFGRLAKGNGRVISTDTIEFIRRCEVPIGKKVTYANFICDYRPLKSEPYRVRLTVGGDILEYSHDAGSPATSLLETKILANSVISDAHKGARFLSADLKDFFLASPMDEPEFMRIHIRYFPEDIKQLYNLNAIVDKSGFVYIKIKKGMYGLKQAAVIAYRNLIDNLEPQGYYPVPHTTGLWKHKTRKTKFCLCVDDFGIKYFSKEDAEHLLNALNKSYKVSVDWTGKNYCGLTFNWNYDEGYVDISIPGYIEKALKRLQHKKSKRPQYSPHTWTQPSYGSKVQMANFDDSPPLNATETKHIQSIVGSFLYYARAIDSTMLPALNEIGAQQASPTDNTLKACKMLMDYASTFPNAVIRYIASDMCLSLDSDAAYLVQPQARSRYAGYFFLSNRSPPLPLKPQSKFNGPILVECKTLRGVVSSAAEAETGGVFHNGQTAIIIRRALEALGHPQPPTPLKTDNSTAASFVHANIRQKRSKTWDMRWNWLRDRSGGLAHLRVYWEKGTLNDADYFTKHHPPNYHRSIRPRYILKGYNVTKLRYPFKLRQACARVCSSRFPV